MLSYTTRVIELDRAIHFEDDTELAKDQEKLC